MSNRLLAGRYELIEKIGEGGMAIVYKGKDRLLNRYVAIKILRPEYVKDEKFITNFIRESQAAAGLTHPNIVGVYDVGHEGNIHYIVMELIEGKALSDIIKERGKLDYKDAINITKQVASALSLAHKNQIVHRDVKPHNIMITTQGVAKLADFGIAKAVSASTLVGDNNKVIGSVHYFSPEQARGAYVDDRSDIYSLGIVLYEMLSGKVPFDGDNPVSIALMHINDPIPPIGKLVSGLPPQLEKIIEKATDKYQTNRFKNADAMIEALDDMEFITKVMGHNLYKEDKAEISVVNEETTDKEIGKPREKKVRAEENLQKANKKPISEKKLNTAILIGIGAVGLAVLIALGFALGWLGSSKKEVVVPKFVGMTYEEALDEAAKLNLKLERGEDVFSPDYEKGIITSQNPSENAKVGEGKVITVVVSKGKKDRVVPSLVGMDYKKGKEYAEQYGFTIVTVVKETSTLPENQIISQTPNGGEIAKDGWEIEVTISDGKGKETVKMPKLIGLTMEEAKIALENANLSLEGKVSYEETEEVEPNIIFWQSIPPNTEVEVGTVVDYKISKAAPPVDPDSDDPAEDDDSSQEGGE